MTWHRGKRLEKIIFPFFYRLSVVENYRVDIKNVYHNETTLENKSKDKIVEKQSL